jgi:hypothetical protein
VSPLRAVNLVAAAVALAAALLLRQPAVFAPLGACALVLFVVGAGSIAADAFPLRSRLALVCSALTPPAAVGLALAGFVGVSPLVVALPPLALTLAPVVSGRRRA